jgi:hypothetical protein
MTIHKSVEIPAYIVLDGYIQNLLQGIVFTQFCNYWGAFADDSLWMKVYVGVVFILTM